MHASLSRAGVGRVPTPVFYPFQGAGRSPPTYGLGRAHEGARWRGGDGLEGTPSIPSAEERGPLRRGSIGPIGGDALPRLRLKPPRVKGGLTQLPLAVPRHGSCAEARRHGAEARIMSALASEAAARAAGRLQQRHLRRVLQRDPMAAETGRGRAGGACNAAGGAGVRGGHRRVFLQAVRHLLPLTPPRPPLPAGGAECGAGGALRGRRGTVPPAGARPAGGPDAKRYTDASHGRELWTRAMDASHGSS